MEMLLFGCYCAIYQRLPQNTMDLASIVVSSCHYRRNNSCCRHADAIHTHRAAGIWRASTAWSVLSLDYLQSGSNQQSKLSFWMNCLLMSEDSHWLLLKRWTFHRSKASNYRAAVDDTVIVNSCILFNIMYTNQKAICVCGYYFYYFSKLWCS